MVDEHLFRHEAGRLTAALTRVFGVHNLALVEDVVQDALCRALETWPFSGVPAQPAAWLWRTAKNRALDVLRRERTVRTFAPQVGWLLESEWTAAPTLSELLEPPALRDDVLRLVLSCCHPRLAEPVQIALVLQLAGGFGVDEIAAAFLSGRAAIEKRLVRGKKVLTQSRSLLALDDHAELNARLPVAQRALYLLFNEGYHGGGETAIRVELCQEAMRLSALLVEYSPTATPATLALGALMCLTAARLNARLDGAGELVPLDDQDRARWDERLVQEGRQLLERSAVGGDISEYHVEAAIAAVHADAQASPAARWAQIVELYDTLLALRPSPVVALQRALAVAQHAGAEAGLAAIGAIAEPQRLERYPFYFAALGELELRLQRPAHARQHFVAALDRTRNRLERRFIETQIARCGAAL